MAGAGITDDGRGRGARHGIRDLVKGRSVEGAGGVGGGGRVEEGERGEGGSGGAECGGCRGGRGVEGETELSFEHGRHTVRGVVAGCEVRADGEIATKEGLR